MKILVIDDEKNVRRILKDYLQTEGYEVLEGLDGADGIEKVMAHKDIDLILLDVRMPKLSGFEAIITIKEYTSAPVIFLTALDENFHEIKGLELGAEDYITKPFNYQVLMARVKTCLRRSMKEKGDRVQLDGLTLDYKKMAVYVDDRLCDLARKEYELLIYLYENRDISLDRFTILERVWGYDYDGDPRTVDTHIKNIRIKIGRMSNVIKTVRGVGYRFETSKSEWS